MSEPWIPEPPPRAPRYEVREVALCPECRCLVRRTILAMTAEGVQRGPWRCGLHGEVAPVWEELEVPDGD